MPDLSLDQEEAIEAIFNSTSKDRVLTGPAGTGKTFMQKVLQERALDHWLNVQFIASTGRAASRLRDSVDAPVLTAHAAVFGSVKEERKLVKQKDGKEEVVRTGKLIFGREHAPCMPNTLLVCDEGGMVDANLHKVLVRNLPKGSTLLYVGDREQLPPVEGTWGPDFDNPTATLTTVHRQALESPIIRLATSIRMSEPFEWDSGFENMSYGKGSADKGAQWLCGRRDACIDATLLTWTNTIRRRTNSKVRALLGLGAHLAVGDKLVCLANNYSLGLMNGETVDVKRVEKLELHPLDALAVWTEDDFFLVAPDLIGLTTTQFKDFQVELEARYANPGVRQHDAEAISSLIEQDPHGWHPDAKELARMFLHADYGFCLTVHKCVHPDTVVETPGGLMPIRELSPEGIVATPEGPRAYRNHVVNPEAPAFRIRVEGGYEVTVTPEHGLDAWRGDRYVREEARHLEEGRFLRLRLGVTTEPGDLPKLPTPTVGDVREASYSVPEVCSGDVAEWLGLFVADGAVFHGGFRLTKRHVEVVERFAKMTEALFGVRVRRLENYNGTAAYCAEVSSTFLSRWVSQIGGCDPHNKHVPSCVLRAASGVQAAFLRGLFEDGSVHIKEGKLDHIQLSQVNARTLDHARLMLLRLGIIAAEIRGEIPILAIYGENATVFGQHVGFITPEKQRRAELPAGEQTRYRVPVSKEQATDFWRRGCLDTYEKQNARERGYVSRAVAARVPELAEALGWHHARIISMEKVLLPSMCIEVPDGHRFLQNGFSGWNSQGSEWDEVGFMRCWALDKKVDTEPEFVRRLDYTAITRARKGLQIWDV